MKITNIQIKGFKSFPDRATINFDEAITGIVGPNGCGKSNIVDAIRWVVGEQKISSLRSENLENLIFNGSKTRSASGSAEVHITFENTKNLLASEFNTVTISRRFYRTGESEYLINNVVCRLKDIHNLLIDTGISSDSYAIIELGMIDDIIRDKENSRRKMLEQAAGISIFKTRRRETELKLQATDQDLSRLEDVLFEINNQLKDLESQARRAQRYLELRKQYKSISIRYAKWSLKNVSGFFASAHQEEKQLGEELESLRTKLHQMEAVLEKIKLEAIEKEQLLRKMQSDLNQLDKDIADKLNQRKLAEQQKDYDQERQNDANHFIEKAHQQITYLTESIAFTTKAIADENTKLQDMQTQLGEKKQALDEAKETLSEKRSALNQVLQGMEKVQQERFDIEKKIALTEAQLQNLHLSFTQKSEQNKQHQQLLTEFKTEQEVLQKKIQHSEQTIAERVEHTTQIKERILQSQEHAEKEQSDLINIQRSYDAKQNEVNLMQNLLDTLDGYPDSVKYLYKNDTWQNGTLLSDILFVKKDFKVCIERCLDAYMNYYVVLDSNKAYDAIGLLKKNNKGKVNFLICDKLEIANSSSNSIPTPEGCFPAIEAIEIEAQYAPVMHYLLHNVFIQNNDSHPQQVKGATIISHDGTWMTSSHTITGGSVGSFEGSRIGRKKSIEKLNEELINLKSKIETKNEAILTIQQEIKNQTDTLAQNETEHLKVELVKAKERLNYVEKSISNSTQSLNEGELLVKEAETSIREIKEENTQANTSLQIKKEEENKQVAERKAMEEDLAKTEDEYQQKQQAYNQTQIELNNQENKISTLQNDLQYKQQQSEDTQKQITQKQHELTELKEKIVSATQTIEQVEVAYKILLEKREADNTSLNQLLQQVDQQRAEITEKEKNLRSLQHNKEAIEKKEIALKEKITTLRVEMASIKERLLLEFKIDVEELITQQPSEEEEESEENTTALKEQMDKLKRSIDNLGDVNPMAVEAYDTHKKRYDFIINQKADLLKAKDNLQTTIKEVEQTVNQNFNETFNQVRTYFQRVFKKLFTEEDMADLVLDKPDNIYETGIDIIAKPKGKRPASINQLSGGEKTLTAIALLFSLYLIKPAPFCVLDEVDAPLDDANVSKFTDMIREFSKSSQFIIVTHNKATMASVDVIYGVTMQETGVSRLVPVDFRSLS